MTRLEGILYCIAFAVLSIFCGTLADNSVYWSDWGVAVVMAVACLAYCLYFMVKVFDSMARDRDRRRR